MGMCYLENKYLMNGTYQSFDKNGNIIMQKGRSNEWVTFNSQGKRNKELVDSVRKYLQAIGAWPYSS